MEAMAKGMREGMGGMPGGMPGLPGMGGLKLPSGLSGLMKKK